MIGRTSLLVVAVPVLVAAFVVGCGGSPSSGSAAATDPKGGWTGASGDAQAAAIEGLQGIDLNGRRELLTAYKTHYAEAVKALAAACGTAVPFEIDWASCATCAPGEVTADRMNSLGIAPIVGAVKNVCRDELGKRAVAEGLKKIVMRAKGSGESVSPKVEGGVLTVVQGIDGNQYYPEDMVQKVLEEQLSPWPPAAAGAPAEQVIKGLPGLGLNGKRALLEVLRDVLPGLQKEVDAAAGASVPVNVDWASFGRMTEDNVTVDRIRRYYLDALPKALRAVAKDDTGKRALQAKLRSVTYRVHKSGDPTDREQTLFFKDGVLTVSEGLDGNGVWDEGAIAAELEKNL